MADHSYAFLADAEFVLRDRAHTITWDREGGVPRDPGELQLWKAAGSPTPTSYMPPYLSRRPLPAAAMTRVAKVTPSAPGPDLLAIMAELQRIEDELLIANDIPALRTAMVDIIEVLRKILVPTI